MKKLSIILIISGFIFVFYSNINSQQNFPRGFGFQMHEKLNLTDAQKNKIEEMKINHQKKMIDLRSNLDKARLDLKEYVSKGNIERNKFLALEEKVAQNRETIRKSFVNHKLDIYELLDANQKKTFLEFRSQFGFERGMMRSNKYGFRGSRNRQCW